MRSKGVVVSCRHKKSNQLIMGSGTLLADGTVLVSGSLLSPFLIDEKIGKWLKPVFDGLSSELVYNKEVDRRFEFTVSAGDAKELRLCAGVWRCTLVYESLKSSFTGYPEKFNKVYDVLKSAISSFLLLKLSPSGLSGRVLEGLDTPIRGGSALIEFTPFGNDFFQNTLSRGVFGNVFGRNGCLFVTDAPTTFECIGAPVYAAENRSGRSVKGALVGVIILPLNDKHPGFALGVCLVPLLSRLVSAPGEVVALNPRQDSQNKALQVLPDLLDDTLVMVICGSFRGSGVVVDAGSGLVITCSHVLKMVSNNIPAKVFYKGEYYQATLVFRTEDDKEYDMAVIKVLKPNVFTRDLPFADTAPEIGDEVISAGFVDIGVNAEFDLKPTIVQGMISRKCPFKLQTTCCIHSGASGSALVKDGRLVGMIVCNLRDESSHTLYPHINFAIPVSVFRDHITNYIRTGEVSCLQNLQTPDPVVRNTWNKLSKL